MQDTSVVHPFGMPSFDHIRNMSRYRFKIWLHTSAYGATRIQIATNARCAHYGRVRVVGDAFYLVPGVLDAAVELSHEGRRCALGSTPRRHRLRPGFSKARITYRKDVGLPPLGYEMLYCT
jgi:hypothetical protein